MSTLHNNNFIKILNYNMHRGGMKVCIKGQNHDRIVHDRVICRAYQLKSDLSSM